MKRRGEMFSGLSVALVTPFSSDGSLNESMLKSLIDFAIERRVTIVMFTVAIALFALPPTGWALAVLVVLALAAREWARLSGFDGGGASAYEAAWRTEIAKLEHPPLMDYLHDPVDYMKPRVYDITDAIWKTPMPGSSCANAG